MWYGGWEVPQSAICKLKAKESWQCSYSQNLKSWEPREPMVLIPVWVKGPRTRSTSIQRQEKMDVLAQAEREFALPLPFCSIQALNGLDVYPHWWGQSPLLSLLIQVLTSSGNTLTVTPGNNILPVIWASFCSIKLTSKINHRRCFYLSLLGLL